MAESFICEVQVLRRIAIPKTVYETIDLKDGDRVRVTIEKVTT
jgi:bifunctional DNA-binding transcriptional regulator/antitoxin component of YhaV-PrlF toxin-antitoxin module